MKRYYLKKTGNRAAGGVSVTQVYLLLFAVVLFVSGCGRSSSPPLEKLKTALVNVPSYSILLEDMAEEGSFSKTYFHKYRVIQEDSQWSSDWMEVSKDYYDQYRDFLGMCIYVKTPEKEITEATPPGYAYVGNPRYGEWRQNSSGQTFWEFYGKYALISNLFGGWYRPIYRNDYTGYRNARARHEPYFGRNREYGTRGRVARTVKPNFYSRKQARVSKGKSAFTRKVANRVGRTRTGYRSRSGGVGK
ncbi:MAG: hypothetical protein CSA22_04115 [Deltaproteobacteria bacterium]|nr:MAG: hypothetical protein CSA22_04115 [Deltaproteobacteria bacterium]